MSRLSGSDNVTVPKNTSKVNFALLIFLFISSMSASVFENDEKTFLSNVESDTTLNINKIDKLIDPMTFAHDTETFHDAEEGELLGDSLTPLARSGLLPADLLPPPRVPSFLSLNASLIRNTYIIRIERAPRKKSFISWLERCERWREIQCMIFRRISSSLRLSFSLLLIPLLSYLPFSSFFLFIYLIIDKWLNVWIEIEWVENREVTSRILHTLLSSIYHVHFVSLFYIHIILLPLFLLCVENCSIINSLTPSWLTMEIRVKRLMKFVSDSLEFLDIFGCDSGPRSEQCRCHTRPRKVHIIAKLLHLYRSKRLCPPFISLPRRWNPPSSRPPWPRLCSFWTYLDPLLY